MILVWVIYGKGTLLIQVNQIKMKKVTIICEGYSELAFCKDILEPHLKGFQLQLYYELISHSKDGGITKWLYIKEQIHKIRENNNEMVISTFFDYYGIDKSHKFPNWADSKLIPNKSMRMELLEKGMFQDIDNAINFIPYIQLHEFEALVFSDYNAFEQLYDEQDANLAELKKICEEYFNPEDINDSTQTAPSKRLLKNINRYNKIESGLDLLKLISLEKVRNKCPRFNNWIINLENI